MDTLMSSFDTAEEAREEIRNLTAVRPGHKFEMRTSTWKHGTRYSVVEYVEAGE